MAVVWTAFIIAAAVLALSAWAATRLAAKRGLDFRSVGELLLAMAIGTALFPAVLPPLGVTLWAGGYAAFVITLTAITTVAAVSKARRTAQ